MLRRALMGWLGRLVILYPGFHRPASGAMMIPGDDPGSVGDDAMMQAALAQLRAQGVDRFGIVKRSKARDLSDYGRGAFDEPKWSSVWGFLKQLSRFRSLYVFGADVMDGFYSWEQTCELLLYGQLAYRTGRQAVFIGFSFNKNPARQVVRYFRLVHPSVSLCVRDRHSGSRFLATVARPYEETADSAFLLQPSGPTEKTDCWTKWIDSQTRKGRHVVGFNINPLTIRGFDQETRLRFLSSLSRLAEHLVGKSYSLLLLPHDYRGPVGDEGILRDFFAALPEATSTYTQFVDNQPSAAEVKQLCGTLFAVLSGRMHLCIAALGRGTPAFGITYQDKFSGLLEYFHRQPLPFLDVPSCLDPAALENAVEQFLAARETLHVQILRALPGVLAAAQRNFPLTR